jgi:serine/threonine protein kinase
MHFASIAIYCPSDGTALVLDEKGAAAATASQESRAEDPYLGVTIAGDIELRALAGCGAMGRVYRAHQRGTERDVAVKILNRELWGKEELVHRFYREAKIAGKLKHPHVVEVYLTGQLPTGALYIVMEYLDGKTLSEELLAHGGSLPFDYALTIGLQVCDALGEAHKHGIIHRDLKPENVMLVRRGSSAIWAKVLDFGIAKATIEEQSLNTAAGAVFGTARYISPEAAQGGKVGPQGDVYSLAVMMYELVSGRFPFEGNGLAVMIKHVREEPARLQTNLAGNAIPEPIVRVIMANLAKDPAARAPNADAFGLAMRTAFSEAGIGQVENGRLSNPSSTGARAIQIDPTLDISETGARGASPNASYPSTNAGTALQPIAPRKSGFLSFALAALTFVLGGLLVAFLMTRTAVKPDEEHAKTLERVKRAITDTHFVAPPGENVKELTELGMKRWPEDPEFKRFRAEAGSQMVTMAMAARSSGDAIGALTLARDAYALSATDNTMRMTKAQCEEEVTTLRTSTDYAGPPKLLFESPPVAKPGEKLELKAKIVTGSAGAKAKISIEATLFPNGKTTEGTPMTITQVDATNVKVTLTAPLTIGSYDVTFKATVAGTVIRAMRDLDISP